MQGFFALFGGPNGTRQSAPEAAVFGADIVRGPRAILPGTGRSPSGRLVGAGRRGLEFPAARAHPRSPADRPVFFAAVPRPKIPMSKNALRELLAALRYMMIDVLESNRGRWVAAIVFGASWGLLALWFLPWGVVLGWIPAALLAIYVGHVCR